jgi:hypothetical protein
MAAQYAALRIYKYRDPGGCCELIRKEQAVVVHFLPALISLQAME